MPSKKQTIKVIIKNALEALAALVVCGALLFVSSSQITNVVTSITQTKTIASEGQARGVAISQLQNQFKIINGNDSRINNSLLHVDNIIPFINSLKDLAAKDKVQQSYTFSLPAPYTSQGSLNVYSIPYSLSVSGNINGLISYLNDFQNMPYFTSISSLNITAPSGLTQGSSMSMSATLYVEQ